MSYDRIAKRAYKPEQRAQILALADRIGAVAAAKELRMLAATIRSWIRKRAGEAERKV